MRSGRQLEPQLPTPLCFFTRRNGAAGGIKMGYSPERLDDGVEVVHIVQEKTTTYRAGFVDEGQKFQSALRIQPYEYGQLRRPTIQPFFNGMWKVSWGWNTWLGTLVG